MIDSPNGVHAFLNRAEDSFSSVDDLILTFETPKRRGTSMTKW